MKTAKVDLLTQKDEITLIKGILHYFDVIEGSAKSLEPHRITFYLLDLVGSSTVITIRRELLLMIENSQWQGFYCLLSCNRL